MGETVACARHVHSRAAAVSALLCSCTLLLRRCAATHLCLLCAHRTDFTGRGELADRQQKLGQMMALLKKVRGWGMHRTLFSQA